MQSSFVIFFIILGLLFGDWKRWDEYYPTLLFWIVGQMLYGFLLYHYRFWEFVPVGIDHVFLPTHPMISLAIAFVAYPFAITVFLGRFPESSLFKKMCWIVLWALLFECVEFIAFLNKSIDYHHGWSLILSFLFNVVTFILLPIHKWKPWAAWGLSALCIGLMFVIFQPPIPK